MDNDQLVSVIVRWRNRETSVNTLESVIFQIWPRIEIIIVDEVACGMFPKVPDKFPVKTISCDDRISPIRARNEALKAATGRWVLMLNDKDIIHRDHIMLLALTLARTDKYRVACSSFKLTAGSLSEQVQMGFAESCLGPPPQTWSLMTVGFIPSSRCVRYCLNVPW